MPQDIQHRIHPSPGGATECSPGREPGEHGTKESQPRRGDRNIDAGRPSEILSPLRGYLVRGTSTRGCRPGLHSAAPPGLTAEFGAICACLRPSPSPPPSPPEYRGEGGDRSPQTRMPLVVRTWVEP